MGGGGLALVLIISQRLQIIAMPAVAAAALLLLLPLATNYQSTFAGTNYQSAFAGNSDAGSSCCRAAGSARTRGYCYICVPILLYMCPHLLLAPLSPAGTAVYVSSYCYISSGLLLLYMCPHTTIYVS